MNLLESLLDAIVRLDGDALVMHVGEKPYVVTASATMNEYRGPLAWGQVELSTRVLTTDAVLGMLGQILSLEQRQALEEYGAIEHEIGATAGAPHRFTVVAARGGDDVWLEVRRRSVVAVPAAEVLLDDTAPDASDQGEPAYAGVPADAVSDVAAASDAEAPPFEIVHDEVQSAPTDADVDAMLAATAATATAAPEAEVPPAAEAIEPEPLVQPVVAIQHDVEPVTITPSPVAVDSEPAAIPQPASVLEAEPAPVREPAAAFEPEPEPVVQPPARPVLAIEREQEPIVEPPREPSILLVREPELVSEGAVAFEVEPAAVRPPSVPPIAAVEPEPLPVAEPVMRPAVAIQPEPEPVIERAPAAATVIEPESQPVAEATVPPAVAFEQEPAPVVQRRAAPAVTLEAEPQPVREAVVTPAARTIEPEPVREPTVVIRPEAEPVDARPDEIPAEPVAAIELEPPAVRVRPAAAAPAAIEPEPEPVWDVPVAYEPEAHAVSVAKPSIEPVSDPVVVVAQQQPAVISLEPETSPIAERTHAIAQEPEPVRDVGVTIQAEPQPVREPAVAVAPEPVIAAAPAPIATAAPEPVATGAPERAAPPPVHPQGPVSAPEHVEPAPVPVAPIASAPAPRAIEPEQVVEPEPIVAALDAPADQRPAIVLPISRSPIKTEPPASESRPAAALPLDRVLRIAAARGAATVYVIAESAPMIRVDGEISALDGETPWRSADIDRLVMDLAPARVRDGGQASGEWVTDVPDVGRVRCVTFRDHRGPGVIFRMIPPRAISAEQLGLSVEIQALCSQSDGIVLVTGARASGKSTLLSAFVDVINRTRSDHVITIEPQIGFVHESRRSFVSQREVRGDSEQTAAAVRSAFREDPDVLMIEDLRTPEIVALALEAAESGRLVFGSIPAPSTVAAIDRVIELFPAERRAQAQTSLAGSLRGVVSQVLLRKSRGGRVAAREVLLNTPAVAGLIMEGKTFQLPVALESGRRQGMMPLADSLAALVREGTVQPAEAYRKAPDREALLTILRREGVDTSFVERLA